MHEHTLALRHIVRIEPTGSGYLIVVGQLVNSVGGQQIAHIDGLVVGDMHPHALAVGHKTVAEQDLDGIENIFVGCAVADNIRSGGTGNLGGLGAVLDDLHAAHIGGVGQIPCERNRTPVSRIAEMGGFRQVGIGCLLQLNASARREQRCQAQQGREKYRGVFHIRNDWVCLGDFMGVPSGLVRQITHTSRRRCEPRR